MPCQLGRRFRALPVPRRFYHIEFCRQGRTENWRWLPRPRPTLTLFSWFHFQFYFPATLTFLSVSDDWIGSVVVGCSAGCCTNQNKIRLIAVDDVTAYNVETVRKMAPVGNQDKWVAEWLCTASYLLAAARRIVYLRPFKWWLLRILLNIK